MRKGAGVLGLSEEGWVSNGLMIMDEWVGWNPMVVDGKTKMMMG